jgi:undecaprenyl-diphosphatase
MVDAWDRELFVLLNGVPHPGWLDAGFWLFTSLGLGWVQCAGLLVGTLAWWRRAGSFWAGDAVRRLLWPGLWAFLLSGGAGQVVKRLVNRPRPEIGFQAPDEAIGAYSFPSGHAATSFALAFVIWQLTRRTRYAPWGWLGWVLAALVGYSRIYRGVHYPGDVLLGAVIGLLAAWGAVTFFRRRYQASGRPE